MTRLLDANYDFEISTAWEIYIDGRFSTVVQEHLIEKGVPESGVSSIVSNASKVLSMCPNPRQDAENKKTGIVIGKVQSGKTSNFLAITALAFDNNYGIVVIMGGTKKILVKQNSDRVREYFNKVRNEVLVFDTERHQELITETKLNQFLQEGQKVIIVTLKSTKQIKKIISNVFENSTLSNEPVIIIDDEGDEASLNNLVEKGKKSPTYSAIEQLKNSINRHAFLSVTATPQANILIDAIDVLSPDFGVLVEPGEGYCGIDVFHGEETKYIKPVPESEIDTLKKTGVPKKLQEALLVFLVGCSVRKYRGMGVNDKFSMLIHPSQIKVDHLSVYQRINTLIENWRLISKNTEDISYKELRSKLQSAYKVYFYEGVDMPDFEDLEKGCLKALQNLGMHVVNGDRVTDDADNFYQFNIYIGGNMLGRGLTLSGLAITYMVRTSTGKSNVDTVEQRARWFGYKSSYLDLCRVYLVPKIIKEFIEIRYHENDLWDTIKNANLLGSNFKNVPRVFILTDEMKMTRPGVAKTKNYAYPFWNFQRHFQDVPEYVQSNYRIINDFREKNTEKLNTLTYGLGLPHKVIYGLPFIDVKREIIDKFIFPEGSQLNRELVNKIHSILLGKGIDPIVDVIWMRDGEPSVHPVTDGIISEYMSGRRPVDKSVPAKYEGDRYFLKKTDVMQLQIHLINKLDSNVSSYTLALYVPEDYISRITNLVIKA